MMKNDQFDSRLIAILDELKTIPARNPDAASRGRAQFLAEAVSARNTKRHNLWTIFQQKDQLSMKLIVSTLVIVGLLFGGNATVAAAQDDLPNQSLYQIKLMSEDVNLWFVSDPIQQIETLMQQAQTRMEEMQSLVSQGVTPPVDIAIRAQERIQRAIQIAARLDGPSQLAALHQIQTRLQTQEQLLNQLQEGTCAECEPALEQTRDMLQIQRRAVESGLATPEGIQNQKQLQNQTQTQHQLRMTQTPRATDTISRLQQETCTPVLDGTGQQNGSDNLSAGTPMQQNTTTNQNGGGTHNGTGSGGGTQNGTGSGGGSNSSPGSGGQGGKP